MDRHPFPPDRFRGEMIQVAGHHDGSHTLLWVIFAVLLVLLVVALVTLVLEARHRGQEPQPAEDGAPPPGGAIAALDTRYASGELSRQDYLQARKDILGPGAAASAS